VCRCCGELLDGGVAGNEPTDCNHSDCWQWFLDRLSISLLVKMIAMFSVFSFVAFKPRVCFTNNLTFTVCNIESGNTDIAFDL
jgi:hypothetical protein